MPKKPQKHYPDSQKVLCVRLNELKERNQLTFSTLSKLLGISEYRVASYFRGEVKPDWETIVNLAELFDVSTDYLLGRSNLEEMSSTQKAACEYLRLPANVVENIRFASRDNYSSANILFSYPDLGAALLQLDEALSIITSPVDYKVLSKLRGETLNSGLEIIPSKEYKRHLIRDAFEDWASYYSLEAKRIQSEKGGEKDGNLDE